MGLMSLLFTRKTLCVLAVKIFVLPQCALIGADEYTRETVIVFPSTKAHNADKPPVLSVAGRVGSP